MIVEPMYKEDAESTKKCTIKNIDEILTVDHAEGNALNEMAMKPNKMCDKYGEILGAVVDNLVCICMYPTNPTVPHWRERAHALCKRFVDLNIDPISKNKPDFRYKWLSKAVAEILDEDYSAISNHFKTVSIYYAKKENPRERLVPYKPYEECYKENKDRVKNGVVLLTKYIAEQDYDGMVDYMNKF